MGFKRYDKRALRPNRIAPTNELLPGLLRGLDTRGSLRLVRLWKNWDKILGPETSKMARPLGHRKKTLILAAEDPIVVQEASFLSPLMLEKINEFLGEEVFDKVSFELLSGRVPLDGQEKPPESGPPKALEKPGKLGSLLHKISDDSAIGRCYRAYVRKFAEKEK